MDKTPIPTLDDYRKECSLRLLTFFETPTSDNKVAAETALTNYREAWIRSKSL